jgi:hypothetical protein
MSLLAAAVLWPKLEAVSLTVDVARDAVSLNRS